MNPEDAISAKATSSDQQESPVVLSRERVVEGQYPGQSIYSQKQLDEDDEKVAKPSTKDSEEREKDHSSTSSLSRFGLIQTDAPVSSTQDDLENDKAEEGQLAQPNKSRVAECCEPLTSGTVFSPFLSSGVAITPSSADYCESGDFYEKQERDIKGNNDEEGLPEHLLLRAAVMRSLSPEHADSDIGCANDTVHADGLVWIAIFDEASKKMYYHNPVANETTWTMPLDSANVRNERRRGNSLEQELELKKMLQNQGSRNNEMNIFQEEEESIETVDVGEVDGQTNELNGEFSSSWQMFFDEASQKPYYFDASTGTTTWERPANIHINQATEDFRNVSVNEEDNEEQYLDEASLWASSEGDNSFDEIDESEMGSLGWNQNGFEWVGQETSFDAAVMIGEEQVPRSVEVWTCFSHSSTVRPLYFFSLFDRDVVCSRREALLLPRLAQQKSVSASQRCR